MVIPRHWRAARRAPRILTLVATPVSTTQINLSWTVDAGNVGLAGFKVYVNATLYQIVNDVNALGFPVTGLQASTTYKFAVAPFDTLGVEYAATPVITQATQVPAVGAGATSTTAAPQGSAGGQGGAIGAGVSVSTAPPSGSAGGAANQPPAFQGTPSPPNFVIGVPSSYVFPQAIDPENDPVTYLASIAGTALPPGFTIDSATRRLVWSGSGTAATTTGHKIRADDGRQSYATSFPATENPISEGGKWVNNGGSNWTTMRTLPGRAMGTNGANNAYDDSYAHLTGYGPNQTIVATIFKAAGIPAGETHEVALHLRMTDSNGNVQTHECLVSYEGGWQIMQWLGPPGQFNELASGPFGSPIPANGDKIKAVVAGNSINFYHAHAATPGTFVLICAANAVFATGDPGMGTFKRPVGTNDVYCFTDILVSSP